LKSCYVLQDYYDNECNRPVFHNITLDLQDQDYSMQDQDRFFFGLRAVLSYYYSSSCHYSFHYPGQ